MLYYLIIEEIMVMNTPSAYVYVCDWYDFRHTRCLHAATLLFVSPLQLLCRTCAVCPARVMSFNAEGLT
jgi:hypothetical protein